MDNNKFVFNLEWYAVLLEYSAEVRYEVYEAIMRYASSGTLTEMKPLAKMAFSFIKKEMDYNRERYESTVEKRREAGKRSAESKAQKQQVSTKPTCVDFAQQSQQVSTKPTQGNINNNVNDNVNVNVNDISSSSYSFPLQDEGATESEEDEDAREKFKKDFFAGSRLKAITKQAENISVSVERYRELVDLVLDDLEATEGIPEPSTGARTKMLYRVRRKHAALKKEGDVMRRAEKTAPPLHAAYTERNEQERREREQIYGRSDYLRGEALKKKLEGFKLTAPEPELPEALKSDESN